VSYVGRDGVFLLAYPEDDLLLQNDPDTPEGAQVRIVGSRSDSPPGQDLIIDLALNRMDAIRSPVILTADLIALDVESAVWVALAERSRVGPLMRLHLIARCLCGSEEPDLFGDWTLDLRHSVLSRLDSAFLDPTRALRTVTELPSFAALRHPDLLDAFQDRLTPLAAGDERVAVALADLMARLESFEDIRSVNWPIDLDALAAGEPELAVDAFARDFRHLAPASLSLT
jgi:hypothetical protein